MIVKVQINIGGALGTLIYNRDKSYMNIVSRRTGCKLLGKEEKDRTLKNVKGFFQANFITLGGKRILKIGNKVKEQNW